MNSTLLHGKLRSDSATARVQRLVSSTLSPPEIVTELYLTCFSRKPTEEEMRIATAPFGDSAATRRAAIEDVLWALLNSAEFVFNH
jgi:hypothetical protein